MGECKYPQGIRTNCNASIYTEIAVEAYSNALNLAQTIKDAEYRFVEAMNEFDLLYKRVISTVVFSAMAIEAFMNDYAAACLGDSEFYDNFDKLSVLSKFQLIAKFIFHVPIDKGKSYYCYLKTLIKNRDRYVHNKSEHFDMGNLTFDEWVDEARQTAFEAETFGEPMIDKADVSDMLKESFDALKAVKEVADFFDAHDDNFHASFRVWRISGHQEWPKYAEKVFEQLKIDKKR